MDVLNKPFLGQIDSLCRLIIHHSALNKHFDLSDEVAVYKKLANLTLNQVRYANALIINNKAIDLNKFLVQIGLKQKNESSN